MKRYYTAVLAVLCIVALLSFLPWLYAIIFPSEQSDPFLAWSPVCDGFVVSEVGEGGSISIIDADGNAIVKGLTKNQRDSLLPQMYFNQLVARNALPDSIAGRAIDVPALKHAQWVFSSMPRDINKVDPVVYPIMESRPKRVDLEDPKEVFTLEGDIRFLDMSSNTENTDRSQRFSRIFAEKGFVYPAISANAQITARKAFDEGYLLIDADHQLFHMKMQAGQPYLAKIEMPDGTIPAHAYILENPDRQLIGLVATADGSLYAIEHSGYKPVRLPINNVDPKKQRIVVMKNLFNWVIRLTDAEASRWIAIDSDDYSLLGDYSKEREKSVAESVARWIFPVRIAFTDINDCYAHPRITDFSWPATIIWLVIITIIFAVLFSLNKHKQQTSTDKYENS